jgi:hypothetical protein
MMHPSLVYRYRLAEADEEPHYVRRSLADDVRSLCVLDQHLLILGIVDIGRDALDLRRSGEGIVLVANLITMRRQQCFSEERRVDIVFLSHRRFSASSKQPDIGSGCKAHTARL